MKNNINPLVLVEHISVDPFLAELQSYLVNFPWDSRRAKYAPVQRETVEVPLRIASKRSERRSDISFFHTQSTTDTSQVLYFPSLLRFLHDFSERRKGVLSRVAIVNLLPQKQVYPHIDYGEYYEVRDRYHLVLSSNGSKMVSGGEEMVFVTGDLFYFNNHLVHESYNTTDEERIHVIFDILPNTFSKRIKVILSICKTVYINTFYYLAPPITTSTISLTRSASVEKTSTINGGGYVFTQPTIEFKDSYIEGIQEFQKEGMRYLDEDIQDMQDNFDTYLETWNKESRGIGLLSGRVTQTVYWLIVNKKYVGRVTLRNYLNHSLLQVGGHIGYDIIPSERRKGYGTALLAYALGKAKGLCLDKVLLTCDEDNIGSRTIIENGGGVLENITPSKGNQHAKCRFWITL